MQLASTILESDRLKVWKSPKFSTLLEFSAFAGGDSLLNLGKKLDSWESNVGATQKWKRRVSNFIRCDAMMAVTDDRQTDGWNDES